MRTVATRVSVKWYPEVGAPNTFLKALSLVPPSWLAEIATVTSTSFKFENCLPLLR